MILRFFLNDKCSNVLSYSINGIEIRRAVRQSSHKKMTPEKWQNVKAVFSEIQNLPSEQRGGFLDRACGGDQELRNEVEHLSRFLRRKRFFFGKFRRRRDCRYISRKGNQQKRIRQNQRKRHFSKPDIFSNQRYEIIRQLGKGGMGEVYLAYDIKLNRDVSLKVLHSDVASNKERLRRFQQEAESGFRLESSAYYDDLRIRQDRG